ncbi:hypothetical protein HHK36_013769 [Tetracentron sinense]|uniref:Uncharacterized protein n=1 Tax=Tetracentron sinense TaxID=13715 RepID=A0A835DER0_TETSI|nr:hypothetical protein HHK36_013769 [Tetracentron sinense]
MVMEAMQAQTVDVIKRMKEITLVMQTPEQVLEAQGVTSGDIEDFFEDQIFVLVIQRGETIYRKAIAMVLLQRNSKPELIWFSFSKNRLLNNNSLSGAFPLSLANMAQLEFLNLSYNNLSGPIPRFSAKTFDIVGNPLICAKGLEHDCHGTMPMPLSVPLNSSQSMDFKIVYPLEVQLFPNFWLVVVH